MWAWLRRLFGGGDASTLAEERVHARNPDDWYSDGEEDEEDEVVPYFQGTLAPSDPRFAARLHAALRGGPGALVYSPASVQLCLAFVQAGARGETAIEMAEVLGLDPSDAIASTKAALAAWGRHARRNLALRVVNRLWVRAGATVDPTFVAILRDELSTPLEQLDFAGENAASLARINAWVAEQTNGLIPELLSQLAPGAQLVLTNALYLKAPWAKSFFEPNTRDEPFHLAWGEAPLVTTMCQVEHHRVAELEGARMIALPYAGGLLAMYIVLPGAVDGLAAIEALYAGGALPRWRDALTFEYVALYLPRFRVRSHLALVPALQQAGMRLAFDRSAADFSGIAPEMNISAVQHEAFIEVDEKGTEAAAATAVSVLPTASAAPRPEPVVFRADRPFLFLVVDTETGGVLFAGRVLDPRG